MKKKTNMKNFLQKFSRYPNKIFSKNLYRFSHFKVVLEDLFHISDKVYSTSEHLEAVMKWLCFAQDIAKSGGVSVGYSFLEGWLPAYPETTGYIIPTFFDYAEYSGNLEYRKRAIQMCDWERRIQLSSGAVISGGWEEKSQKKDKQPAVFNTGQVISGWCRGYQETENKLYLDCAKKAGDWLVAIQDEDGAWRKGLSPLLNSPPTHAYHSRVSWALIELSILTNEEKYQRSAVKNLNWVLTQQNKNGWFSNNSFYNNQNPLTHAICYTIEGLLESGILLNEEKYKKVAIFSAKNLLDCFEGDKKLYASYDKNWKSKDSYTCLTGDAQASLIWLRIYEITKDPRFLNAALRMNAFLKTTQHFYSKNPGIRGGIKGSHPVWGQYCPFFYPDWAAKFFADAFLLEEKITQK